MNMPLLQPSVVKIGLCSDQPDYIYGNRATRYKNSRSKTTEKKRPDLKYLDALIYLLPNKPEPYYDRGTMFLHSGDIQQAIIDLTRAINLDNGFALAYSNRGLALSIIDRHHEAIADFDTAIKLNSSLMEPLLGRGAAYSYLHDYVAALADFNQCLRLRPEQAELYLNRAEVSYYLAQLPEAIADCGKALELNPNLVEGYTWRGLIHMKSGKYLAALNDLNNAIRLDENYPPAYLLRSSLYQILGIDAWLDDRKRAYELDNTLNFSPA